MKIKILIFILPVISIHASYPAKQSWTGWKGAYERARWSDPGFTGRFLYEISGKKQQRPYSYKQESQDEYLKTLKFQEALRQEEAERVKARLRAAAASSENLPKAPSISRTPQGLFGTPLWFTEKRKQQEQKSAQSMKPYYRTPRVLTTAEEEALAAAYGPGEYMPTSPEVYKGLRSERLRAYKQVEQEARAAREALKEKYYQKYGIRPHELEGSLK